MSKRRSFLQVDLLELTNKFTTNSSLFENKNICVALLIFFLVMAEKMFFFIEIFPSWSSNCGFPVLLVVAGCMKDFLKMVIFSSYLHGFEDFRQVVLSLVVSEEPVVVFIFWETDFLERLQFRFFPLPPSSKFS